MARNPVEFAEKKSPTKKDGWVPSPAEIQNRAAEIRSSWSPEERRQREVNIPGWSLLPIILGSDRLPTMAPVNSDRTRRGR